VTIKTWRYELLKICKYCKSFWDTGKSRGRYQCTKHKCHIYDAHGCKKTFSIREKASAISKELLDNAFFELIGKHKEEKHGSDKSNNK
jgi:hypothetical protein